MVDITFRNFFIEKLFPKKILIYINTYRSRYIFLSYSIAEFNASKKM